MLSMKTMWDYSDRANTYDKRADYSYAAVKQLLDQIGCSKNTSVADIGAGTGKLTKILLAESLIVRAVEPNFNMRTIGMKNTQNRNVSWTEGVGEATGLPKQSFHAAFFGSSFNVVDQEKTLNEVARILVPDGWFVCMWNHRDLTDCLQKKIEQVIHIFIPNFNYGIRRKDPTDIIKSSSYFGEVERIQKRFIITMEADDIVDAWRSHDTLFRQSGDKFDEIINAISEELTLANYKVPYFTRIWFSRLLPRSI